MLIPYISTINYTKMKYCTTLFATLIFTLFTLIANAQDNPVTPKYGKYN